MTPSTTGIKNHEMNIFILDLCQKKAAIYHCDKHVVKMIVEYAQLLSVCKRLSGDENPKLYKLTHTNHPCAIWVRESKANYEWLYKLFVELCSVYKARYMKTHFSFSLLNEELSLVPISLPDVGLTPFQLAMPEAYKDIDPVIAYRKFYIGEKSKFASWRAPHSMPDWFKYRNPFIGNENARLCEIPL